MSSPQPEEGSHHARRGVLESREQAVREKRPQVRRVLVRADRARFGQVAETELGVLPVIASFSDVLVQVGRSTDWSRPDSEDWPVVEISLESPEQGALL